MNASEESDLMDRAREFAEQFDSLRTHVEVLEERVKQLESSNRRERKHYTQKRQARSNLPNGKAAGYNTSVEKT